MHEVEVLDQGLAEGPSNRLSSPVSDQPPSDLILNLLTKPRYLGIDLFSRKSSVEGVFLVESGESGFEKSLLEGVQIEAAESPIEVVGATDRTTRLDPGKIFNRSSSRGLEGAGITTHDRSEQGLDELVDLGLQA
jgi:hypothetical protein